jgi:O-antigen biosynthesis protein
VISVVVATLDRPDHVERCVRSLVAGARMPDEVIVVDQAGGGGSRHVVEGLGARWIHQEERNASLARNRGVELASSDYVALLDDDAEVGPSWLVDAERALDELGRPDALFGAVVAPGPIDRRELAVSTHDVAAPTVWPSTAHPAKPGFSCHAIVRRSAFLEVGGFDPRLGPGSALYGAEDMDLNYRMLRGGRVVASTPAVSVTHHQWREQDELPWLMYSYNLGHSAFCAKHLRRGDLGVLRLVGRQLLDDGRMLGSAVRRRSWLRARVAVWRFAGTVRGLFEGWRRLAPG